MFFPEVPLSDPVATYVHVIHGRYVMFFSLMLHYAWFKLVEGGVKKWQLVYFQLIVFSIL